MLKKILLKILRLILRNKPVKVPLNYPLGNFENGKFIETKDNPLNPPLIRGNKSELFENEGTENNPLNPPLIRGNKSELFENEGTENNSLNPPLIRGNELSRLNNKYSLKILIYRCDAIGDYIVTTPLINLIKEHLPAAEIHFLLSPRNEMLAKVNYGIKKCYVYDNKFMTFIKLLPKMRTDKYDIVFTFMLYRTSKTGIFLNFLLGSKVIKIGMEHEEKREEHNILFNKLITVERNKMSLVELQAEIVCKVFGWEIKPENLKFDLPVSQKDLSFAENFLKKHNFDKFIAYNISAGRSYNLWSYEKHNEFFTALLKKFPEQKIIIIATPPEAKIAEKLIKNFDNNIIILPPDSDLLKVIAVISKSEFVITPDTSIVHIAAAYQKPVLAFFTRRTSFLKEWVPFGVPSEILIAEDRTETLEISEVLERYETLLSKIE